MKYIYITGFINEGVFREVKRGMDDAASLLGVSAELVGSSADNYELLNDLILEAVHKRYDGIAVNFIHPTKLNEAVKTAMKAEIPVVAFNIDSRSSKRLSAVCQNFYEAGRTLGKKLADKIPPFSSVLFTQHTEAQSALDERLAGIQLELDDKNINSYIVIAGKTPEEAKHTIEQVLREYENISWIVGTGQSDTHGAGLAARALAPRALQVAGFDYCREIGEMMVEDVIVCTIDQQPYVQGFYPLMMLHQYNVMGLAPFDINTGCNLIDKTKLSKKSFSVVYK